MINSKEILKYMRQASYRPMAYRELLEAFSLARQDESIFSRVLGQMEKQGLIVKTRKDKYGLPEKMNMYRGAIKLSQRGYGILLPEEPGVEEIFVYGRNLNGAMHGDRVLVRIHRRGGYDQRPEGEVVRVINRASDELVGTFEKSHRIAQVIPDDPRQIYPINVRPSSRIKVKNGDKVLVKITGWPTKGKNPEGKISEVFGHKGQPGMDVQIIIKKHGLRDSFPPAVLEEAVQMAKPVSEQEIKDRRDLRDLRMVTIDGEDAKDLDDAVSVSKIEGGFRLGVHIADVSYYVREGSRLDQEAFERGTSVYLVDKVLPMLPQQLSNGICSLNAREERLAISCIMDIDPRGQVFHYDICRSLIKVRERMTYTDVNHILAGDNQEIMERYRDLVADFRLMKELADILRGERMKRGALDFDFPESKVIVDEHSFPLEIKAREQGPGEMLIEDFMIKANETVAEHLCQLEAPILYRVHEKPDDDSLNQLNGVLGIFGYKIKGERVEPRVFQKILEDIKGRPEEKTIALMLLRSMKHARYVHQPLGHFGLASRFYCHFTSPIRRYPDLIVHRVLTMTLQGSLNAKKKADLKDKMVSYGEHSTLQEIKAEEAERELVDIKKAQYMEQFVGEEFTARISSVQAFGFFVELPNTVEGLVHVSTIADDYYQFNDQAFTLVGVHRGRKFSIGDEVRVQLVKVDVDAARIDFELSNGFSS